MPGATTLRELLVKFGVDTEKSGPALAKFDASIEKAKASMDTLVGYAAKATVAIAGLAAAAVYQATATGEYAEQVREQAQALGLTTDAYQELSFAASKYGIDSEKITVILSKLAVDQKAVADGNEDAAATYQALGLSVDQVKNAKPEELLKLMADGFGTVGDATTRLALASTLFGDRIASQLLPLLAGGSEGLAAMAAQAHALGVVMTEESIKTADAFNDQVENLGLVLTGVRNEIGIALIPALSKVADRFLVWYEANQQVIAQKVDEYATKVGDGFTAAADALAYANDVLGGAEGWATMAGVLSGLAGAGGLVVVVAEFVSLAAAVASAVAAAAAFVGGGWVLVAIVAAIAQSLAMLAAGFAVFAGAIAVVEDFWTYLQGGDSVIGRLIVKWREATGSIGAIARVMEALGKVGSAVLFQLGSLWEWFSGKLDPVISAIGALADLIGGALVKAFDTLAPYIDKAATTLERLATAIGPPGGTPAPAGAYSAAATPSVEGAVAAGASTVVGTTSRASEYAPAARTAAASATRAPVTIGGDTNNFYGTGMSLEEVQSLITRTLAEKARRTKDALAGAEV